MPNLKTTSNEFLDNAKANGLDFQLNFKYGKHPTLILQTKSMYIGITAI